MLLSAGTGLAGGSLAVRLTAYRMDFLPVSLVALAAGFYLSYWRRMGPRWNRVVLWVASVLTAILWGLPYLIAALQR